MPKKKNKKDKKDANPSDPVEALRAAIERTFHATTEGAAGTQKRSRQLVDEVTHAAARIRATIEELRVLDEVKGLRNDIEALGRRIAALEARDGAAKPTASKTASRARTTRSTGATPWQTLSRELQELRDRGLLEFVGTGVYRYAGLTAVPAPIGA